MSKYVIIESNDCTDPIVHGIFKNKEQAEKYKKILFSKFSDWEYRHETILTVEKIREVK